MVQVKASEEVNFSSRKSDDCIEENYEEIQQFFHQKYIRHLGALVSQSILQVNQQKMQEIQNH